MSATQIDVAIAIGVAVACCLVVRLLYRDRPGLMTALVCGLAGGFGGAFLGLFPADLMTSLGMVDPSSQRWVMSGVGSVFALLAQNLYATGVLGE